jgi:peptide deformylase
VEKETDLPLLEIIAYPNPGLLIKAELVSDVNEEIQEHFRRMVRIMYRYNGIGLAAPQIGIPLRLIVVRRGDWIYRLANPKISWVFERLSGLEGCLSVPGEIWQVERAWEIVVEAIDSTGREQSILADGLIARVFQHEIDHLNGILINSIGTLVERYE